MHGKLSPAFNYISIRPLPRFFYVVYVISQIYAILWALLPKKTSFGLNIITNIENINAWVVVKWWSSKKQKKVCGDLRCLRATHARAKSRDHDIVRFQEKYPKAVPRHVQTHVVWSHVLNCSVKPYVTRPSTKCYLNEFLFMWGHLTW